MLWKQYQILRIKSCVLKAHILIQKKNDFINQHYYHTEAELYTAVEEFAYVQYNLLIVK